MVALATVRDLFSGLAVARTMSRLMLVIGLAPIVAPSLGGFILEVTDWRGIFVVLAGAAALLVVVALVGLRETLPVERRRSARVGATLRTYRSLLHDRTFVALVLMGGLMLPRSSPTSPGRRSCSRRASASASARSVSSSGANALALALLSQVNPPLIRRFGQVNVLTGAILDVDAGLRGPGGHRADRWGRGSPALWCR